MQSFYPDDPCSFTPCDGLFVGAVFALVADLLARVARRVAGSDRAVSRQVAVLPAVKAPLASETAGPGAAWLVRDNWGSTSIFVSGLARAVAGDVADLAADAAVAVVNLLRGRAVPGDVPHLPAVAALARLRHRRRLIN